MVVHARGIAGSEGAGRRGTAPIIEAMPTYEYACQSCGTHVEVFQRFSEAPLTSCGVCGGELRKVFHPAGILFKGSGFYVNDSRSGGGSKGSGTPRETAKESTRDGGKEAPAAAGSKPESAPSSTGSGGKPKEKSA
jgi:putative FmdB family regulatory protein